MHATQTRTCCARALALTVLLAAADFQVQAATAEDREFAFAQHLQRSGKQAFALLEYDRFAFLHPEHAHAPEAAYQAAWLELTYADDMPAARQRLGDLMQMHPRTPAGRKAHWLAGLLRDKADHAGKPLLLYLEGVGQVEGQHYAEADAAFQQLLQTYPRAAIAEETLLARGKLLILHRDAPREGLKLFRQLLDQYPRTTYTEEIHYHLSVGLEAMDGPTDDVLRSYEGFVQRFPNSPYVPAAEARLRAMREGRQARLQRQFAAVDVQEYKTLQKGYDPDHPDRYRVVIEMALTNDRDNVLATLEEALFAHARARQDPDHRVRVEAYFNHPRTAAGTASWTPGEQPAYAVVKRKAKDVAKDIFFELLKGATDSNEE